MSDTPSTPVTEPTSAQFKAVSGGNSTHNIGNPTEVRIAIKVKTSDNNLYKVAPVFSFIEAGMAIPIEISRAVGPPKEDKLIIQYTNATADMTNAQEVFKTGEKYPNMPVALSAQ